MRRSQKCINRWETETCVGAKGEKARLRGVRTPRTPLYSKFRIRTFSPLFHANIKLVCQLGKSIPFLDVYNENTNGVLQTSVYRKEAAEPYVVSFNSDHSRHTFVNIIDAALLRAIRYSSTLSVFDKERRSIKLMLLYNG
jgi:hypothetical protein